MWALAEQEGLGRAFNQAMPGPRTTFRGHCVFRGLSLLSYLSLGV